MKELREAIKHGKTATNYFVKFNSIEDIKIKAIDNLIKRNYKNVTSLADLAAERIEGSLYYTDKDDTEVVEKSIVFDAIESVDTFIAVDEITEEVLTCV